MSAAQNRRVAEILRMMADKFEKAAEVEKRDPRRGEYETRWAWNALESCLHDDFIHLERRDMPRNPWPLDRSKPGQPDSLWLANRGD